MLSPRMLGRYALYDQIATGGMASVHVGRLLGPVGFARTVAIKRMHPQLAADPEFVSMFLDEARLAARISHPNVVPTLDVVATEGELFLVMEYVAGESLARLIRAAVSRGETVPAGIAATIMVGVLYGLHAAHEARSDQGEPLGIVHRDVSPHNVLVGVDGVARVLDFGVAKAVGRVQTTREGQLKGKLPYMAPEQVHGTVTRATDVYAASVVLWEALTGRRLFKGEHDGQVLGQVLQGCRVPPSAHAGTELPPEVDAVVMRGLRVDPAERFPTARDMARALEDAILLVNASKIGEWIEALVRDVLDERSGRIARIESSSSARADATAPPHVADESTSVLQPEDVTATQLSSGSTSSPELALPRSRRSVAWLAIAGAAGGCALGAALVAARPRHAALPLVAVAEPVSSWSDPGAASSAAAPSARAAESAGGSTVDSAAPAASSRPGPARAVAPPPAPRPPAPAYNPLEHL